MKQYYTGQQGPRRPYTYMDFRCAVIENNVRCGHYHSEPIYSLEEQQLLFGSGFICEDCRKLGFEWLSVISSNVVEEPGFAQKILTDPFGKRTDSVLGRPQGIEGGKTAKYTKWLETPQYNDIIMILKDALVDENDISKGRAK